jgi:hypothetical protein
MPRRYIPGQEDEDDTKHSYRVWQRYAEIGVKCARREVGCKTMSVMVHSQGADQKVQTHWQSQYRQKALKGAN